VLGRAHQPEAGAGLRPAGGKATARARAAKEGAHGGAMGSPVLDQILIGTTALTFREAQ
jgi:hypothetical protein